MSGLMSALSPPPHGEPFMKVTVTYHTVTLNWKRGHKSVTRACQFPQSAKGTRNRAACVRTRFVGT